MRWVEFCAGIHYQTYTLLGKGSNPEHSMCCHEMGYGMLWAVSWTAATSQQASAYSLCTHGHLPGLECVTISKLGQKVTLQGIEPGSLL
jgi:hypothetical protein